jgi:hypothetical protein
MSGDVMKKPILLLIASLFLSSSDSQATQKIKLVSGVHLDVVELIEKLPVKDISELPLRAQGLRHAPHHEHPYGIIYKGVRYVDGHAKILATKHHVENKLAWFKGLVDHVRMTSKKHAHYNIHESSTILDETVETLQTKLEDIVEKAPNEEAKRKLHEDGWKMIHDLVNELRPEVANHKLTYLANELLELKKSSEHIKKEQSQALMLPADLPKKACELHNKGVSLADINKAIPVPVDAIQCAKVAPRNAVLTPVSQ